MEIERKFLLKELPENLDRYSFHTIEQAYLNTKPVVRIRREDDTYYLTYKGSGLMTHEEYNLPLDKTSYEHLREKADGRIIRKKRYLIPLSQDEINSACYEQLNHTALTIELDIFEGDLAPLVLAEIEFPNEEAALAYEMHPMFAEDVTSDPKYHNSNMIN